MCDVQDRELPEDERPSEITDFVDQLIVAVTNSRIYWRQHPRVMAAVQALVASLQNQFSELGVETVDLGAADGFLFFQKRPLLGASLSAPRLLEPLSRVGSGGLRFHRAANDEDFLALVEFLGRKSFPHESADEANADLREQGCRNIELLPPYWTEKSEETAMGLGPELSRTPELEEHTGTPEFMDIPRRLYQDVVDRLQALTVRASVGSQLDMTGAQGCVEELLACLREDADVLLRISRYEQYDAFTFGHSIRVCLVALNFGRALTDDEELLNRIGLAALLHDIGKAWVPFEVLHARGRLTDEERLEMNKHSTYGAEILLELANSDPLSVATAFGHHRTIDQGGYPQTIHKTRQSTATRIIKICDVYEALTAVRPYKPRMSPVRAYRIMMGMENHFAPDLLRRFMTVNGIYPIGSRLKLSNGATARVRDQTALMEYPVVLLEEEGELLDLSQQPGEALAVEHLLLGAQDAAA